MVDSARSTAHSSDAVGRMLSLLGITYRIDATELSRVPAAGPVLMVSNHPFGLLGAAILAGALPNLRQDVRILANSLLAAAPEHGRPILIQHYRKAGSVLVPAPAY
jgi:putative hemolysin